MFTSVIIVFILGYIAIAFEHPLKLNKAASALITGVLCWTLYVLQSDASHTVTEELLHHLGEIASILFFLLGAMTIVELIDSHNGFDIITEEINTTSKRKLLFIVAALTFFFLPCWTILRRLLSWYRLLRRYCVKRKIGFGSPG
jgi:Na+/H+ antiporter NhaD/arsenite permease-like protein